MTAVEWLFDNLDLSGGSNAIDTLNKAKEMEKEQIKDAFQDGSFTGCGCYDYMREEDAEKYYNETYKQIT